MRLNTTINRIDLASPNLKWIYPLALIVAMWQTARERRQLSGLDDRALADLGLDVRDVRRETSRPFWDLPIRQQRRLERI
ncbi:MAG: DUF1127 domain-containing protein [Geminicoccaceae bacterium]|nr:DUF1127 domain-containing protein [Geminicoccaceae bacterium]